eukprot:4712351-Pyramimonas_sp.AAC.1
MHARSYAAKSSLARVALSSSLVQGFDGGTSPMPGEVVAVRCALKSASMSVGGHLAASVWNASHQLAGCLGSCWTWG